MGLMRFLQSMVRPFSFGQNDVFLCQKVNHAHSVALQQTLMQQSHPAGFVKEFNIPPSPDIELYANILASLQNPKREVRLKALQLLGHVYKDQKVPFNTLRMRLYLIKCAMQNQDSFTRQLQYIRMFQKTFSASQGYIQHLLQQCQLVVLLKTDAACPRDGIFDAHVLYSPNGITHTPSSLLVNLFIMGMQNVTLVCSTMPDKESCFEAYEAARQLAITLHFGFSFDVYQGGYQAQYVALAPTFVDGTQFLHFYAKHQIPLERFERILEQRQTTRLESIQYSLDVFNKHHLDQLNQHFSPKQPLYYLKPLRLQDIETQYPKAVLTYVHIGNFLYQKYKKILFNRLIFLDSMQQHWQWVDDQDSQWNQAVLCDLYDTLKHEYDHLSPQLLIQRYFSDLLPEKMPHTTQSVTEVARFFHSIGGKMRFVPSSNLDKKAYQFLFKRNDTVIDEVEIYNCSSSVSLTHTLFVAQLLEDYNKHIVQTAAQANIVQPVCASYSLGEGESPAAGFVFGQNAIMPVSAQALPPTVASLIYHQGQPVEEDKKSVPIPPLYHLEQTEPTTHKPRLSLWGRLIQFVGHSPINYCFSILALLFSLYYTTPLMALPVRLGFFALGTVYLYILLCAHTSGTFREKESLLRERLPFVLFFAGFFLSLQQKIIFLFSAAWLQAVPSFLVILLQAFCLASMGLFSVLFYAKTFHTLPEAVLNPVLCLILAWPLTSVCLYYWPLALIPASAQIYLWTFALGILGGLGALVKANRLKRQTQLEEMIQSFSYGDVHAYLAVLDLLYVLPRYRHLRTFCKQLALQKTSTEPQETDPPLHPLAAIYQKIQNWCQDPGRYQQILEFILAEYSPTQAEILVETTLKNWDFLLNFLQRHTN